MVMSNAMNAEWLRRFATRLIQLNPAIKPLDAVRSATQRFPSACDLEPEKAAEISTGQARALDECAPSTPGNRLTSAPRMRH
jgi:hypothetical protein